jgi:uncharacterized membrane protein YhaH (DUF805 family)
MTEAFNTPPFSPSPFPMSLEPDSPWSYKGRFGRLSFVAWSLVTTLIFGIIAGVFFIYIKSQGALNNGLSHIFENLSITSIIIGAIFYILFVYIGIVFSIRRLHDINLSGWWILVAELANIHQILKYLHISGYSVLSGLSLAIGCIFSIYLFFAKGSAGPNRFGAQRPTPQWEKILGWIYVAIIPTVLTLGIVAAIAIPAYQMYEKRAHAAQDFSQSSTQSVSGTSTATAPATAPTTQ